MPCTGQGPTEHEIEHSKVLALLHELETGVLPRWYGDGGIKQTYGVSRRKFNEDTALLCSKLQEIDDLSKYSKQMRIWWRRHMEHDLKRLLTEEQLTDREELLSRLTPYEKKLLGI